LIRPGTAAAALSGGTIDFARVQGQIYAGSDLIVDSLLRTSGGVKKTGPGTMVLNAPATWTGGTSVDDGRLVPGPGNPLATQLVTVRPGGVLDLAGQSTTIGGISGAGPIELGASTLTIDGNLSLFDGAQLNIKLDSDAKFGRFNVNGKVALDFNVQLALTLQFDPTDGIDSFTLIDNDAVDSIAGRFRVGTNVLDEGEVFQTGNQAFRISYSGGTGNDIVLYAVPEAGETSLLVLATFLTALHRRRVPLQLRSVG